MKKIYLILFIFFGITLNVNAETNRIISGKENAKITIIAYESLTCSHCANFHKDVYPSLKKDFIDTGLVKIEFRHFPLDIAALNASKISLCKQDQSLEILEKLYSNQQAWIKGKEIEEVNNNLKEFLKKAGFDIDFEKCTNNALASLTLYFQGRMPCMQISTNLIQPNQFNPEGILCSMPALKVGEHFRIPNLIYWKLAR